MWPIWLILTFRLVSFAGAIAQTLGVISFFTFDGLAPFRIPLIVGGTAAILISEGLVYVFVTRMAKRADEAGRTDS